MSDGTRSTAQKNLSVERRKIRVAVLSGGASSERKISLRSGAGVAAALKEAGYTVSCLDPRDWSSVRKHLPGFDAVFIALHGQGGEDGVIQSKLERMGIAYIGSNARASLKAFDKAISKKIFIQKGIPVPRGIFLPDPRWREKLSTLRLPLFVKPAREGSSIGVFQIEDLSQAAEKLRKALRLYKSLLVEEKIEGREFTVGVVGNKALSVVEMKPKSSFYDFKAKYTKGMTDYQVPARISPVLATKMKKLALRVHRALGMRDLSRVDFMVDQRGNPFVLEANSIPGFTPLSLLPKAAQADGLSFPELCSKLIEFALLRKK